jgi:hypothetical protein
MRSSSGMVGITPLASRRDRAGWVIAARRASSVWDSHDGCDRRRRRHVARPQVQILGSSLHLVTAFSWAKNPDLLPPWGERAWFGFVTVRIGMRGGVRPG